MVPPTGIYFQIYRDAVRGADRQAKRDTLLRLLDRTSGLGLPGVVLHGFPRELTTNWEALAKAAEDRRLLALASWGMDGTSDNDRTKLTAAEKGQCVGQVLAHAKCAAGLIDAEGAFDTDTGPDDDTDEQGALVIGTEIRKLAPSKPLGDQCWFAIQSHGDLRRKPGPLGPKDVFKGFPVDEFAPVLDWGRFRQAYCNNFVKQWGTSAYERVFAWMDRDWASVDAALQKQGLSRPLSITIQGYRWNMADLTHCLLERQVRRSLSVIVWGEPYPDDEFLRGLRFVQILCREGFAGAGVDPVTAIKQYQTEYNRHAPAAKQLVVDGVAGEKTVSSAVL